MSYCSLQIAQGRDLAEAAREKRRRDTYNAVWFELEREASRLFVAGEWPVAEMWVDLRHTSFSPYTLSKQRFPLRRTHTARTDEALRLRVDADGGMFVHFTVAELTPLDEEPSNAS